MSSFFDFCFIMCYNFFVSPERITVSLRDMPLRQVPRIVGRKKVFMFDQPIHSTPLSTLEDIKKFSYEYGVLKAVSDDKEFIKTFCQKLFKTWYIYSWRNAYIREGFFLIISPL